jgi:hypothetical protein
MLMGPEDTFEVLEWSSGSFFIRADILQLDNSSKWLSKGIIDDPNRGLHID